MKFTITFKDPDGVSQCMDHILDKALSDIEDPEERELLREYRQEKIEKVTEDWIEYGEYISIEFDSEANTATVLKNKR